MNQKKMIAKKKKKPNKTRAHAKAIHEYTAGGVVYREVGGELEFLLIQDVKNRWSIPKGHVEPGETLEQTAIREIAEETGIKSLRIIGKLDKIHFFYRLEGKLIFMTTFVFLMKALKNEELIHAENSEGIIDAKWFNGQTALDAIEYKDTKILIQLAIDKLTTIKKHD